MSDHTIVGLRFNDRGVVVPDAKVQETWAKAVNAERIAAQLAAVEADEATLARAVAELDALEARLALYSEQLTGLQTALRETLRRIQQIEDETMGAALAARFDPDTTRTEHDT